MKREYNGFEQGVIRPPSEAQSLLLRITRNCSWNRCTFCSIYKSERFSTRPLEDIKADIDLIHQFIKEIDTHKPESEGAYRNLVNLLESQTMGDQSRALYAAIDWYRAGMRSIFLQDANSPVLKAAKLVEVLSHLKRRFPDVERITTYARSKSILRYQVSDLINLKEAGLNRIHIGFESGSDEVLKRVKKGVTKAEQVEAGQKVKEAGIELSEYVMPGLGGKDLSKIHALESADALNQIQPDFIRLRTLALPVTTELFEEQQKGQFEKCSEKEVLREIELFVRNLTCQNTNLKSDHMLNLMETLNGHLPDDKEKLLTSLQEVLNLRDEEFTLFQVGRRFVGFNHPSFLKDPAKRGYSQQIINRFGITPDNCEQIIEEQMKRFI